MPKQRRRETSQRHWAILLTALCGCAGLGDGEQTDEYLGQVEAPGLDASVQVALDAAAPVADDAATPVDAGPPPPPPNVVKLKDETGAEVAEIIASGRGCPRESWGAEMNADGRTFTITFSELDIALDVSKAFSSANCLLTILPPRWESTQFSAQTITYSGQATLGDGVVGAIEVRHFYQGGSSNAPPGHAYEQGPFEGAIDITREVPSRDARWTPCGARRRGVNVDLLLRLTNGVPRASGTFTSDASKLVVALTSRACPSTGGSTPR
jgi:hypothetical protein